VTSVLRSRRARVGWKLLVAFAACSILSGCDDGPTSPEVPNIAGTWQGRYFSGIGAGFDPCEASSAVTATFLQDRSRTSGTLTTQSQTVGEATFEGELVRGSQLRGTLTSSGTPRTVVGSASANHLTMSFSDHPACTSSHIELDR
jgi:hypothetical protein